MPFVDIFAAFRWWLVLMILGLIALPLAQVPLRRIPDKGYSFTKMIGLLIVSFVYWLFGSLGFLENNLAGILFGVAVLGLFSFWAYRVSWKNPDHPSPYIWMRENWKYVLTAELLFTGVFILWVWVRAQNPAISGTEKPMEFAFLNSLSRSPSFPPVDPWLSGFSISYYYFGYVMSSVLGRLSAVPGAVGFNLALVWLAAGTALGAFGLVYNLVASGIKATHRAAVIAALIAGIALPLAGNLEIILEVAHANGVGGDQLWNWLDVRDLSAPAVDSEVARYETSQWWWWRSSRVIHEYHLSNVPEEGLEPIAEFPAFSLILGDLHAHVLALPYAFLGLALSLAWWRREERLEVNIASWFSNSGFMSQLRSISSTDKVLIIFTGLVLGGLSFLNTWDVLIHLFVVLGAFLLAQWRLSGKWNKQILFETATLALTLVLLAILLYLPFYIGFRSQAAPPFLLPMIMQPTRLAHFLIIFGMPLIVIVLLLGALTISRLKNSQSGSRKNSFLKILTGTAAVLMGLLFTALLLGLILAASQEGAPRVVSLAEELSINIDPLPGVASLGTRISWAIPAIAAIAPSYLMSRLNSPFLILFLLIVMALSAFIMSSVTREYTEKNDDGRAKSYGALPFVLLLITTAALLTLAPEFVYLRDNFGQRINTVFKFYYQAWILFGVSALYAIDYLLRNFRAAGVAAGIGYGITLLLALLFPYFAIQSRAVEYRGPLEAEERAEATLNGLAYLERSNDDEMKAINWLSENVSGVQVILEAVGGQYSDFGRISSSTGLPTLLGWAGHEYQWRGSTTEPAVREAAVRKIYESVSLEEAAALLDEYEVSYIVLGPRETRSYSAAGREKFEQFFDLVFSSNEVTVYRWQPQ